MKLQDFIDVLTLYEQGGELEEYFWDAHHALGDYLAHALDPSRLGNHIVPFLKKWNSYRTPIDWAKLAQDWNSDKQEAAKLLHSERLEDSEDDKLREADRMYRCLLNVPGIGDTNASKLLALGSPELCVIWDKPIRERHPKTPPRPGRRLGPQRTSEYYRFLQTSRQVLNDIIQQYMEASGTGRIEAVARLRELPVGVPDGLCPREKPLAKLLDEYNYRDTRRRTD